MLWPELVYRRIAREMDEVGGDLPPSSCTIVNGKGEIVWPPAAEGVSSLRDLFLSDVKPRVFASSTLLFGEFGDMAWAVFSNDPWLCVAAWKELMPPPLLNLLSRNLSKAVSTMHFLAMIDNYNNFFSDLNKLTEIPLAGHETPQLILDTCWNYMVKNDVLSNIGIYSGGIAVYLRRPNGIENEPAHPNPTSRCRAYTLKAFSCKPSFTPKPKRHLKIDISSPSEEIAHAIGVSKNAFLMPFISPSGLLTLFIDDNGPLRSLSSSHIVMLQAYFNTILIKLFPSIASIHIARELIADLSSNLFDSVATSGIHLDNLSSQLLRGAGNEAGNSLFHIRNEIRQMEEHINNCALKFVPFPEVCTVVDMVDLVHKAVDDKPVLKDLLIINAENLISIPVKIRQIAMAAVIRGILRNVLCHAYPEDASAHDRKVTIESRMVNPEKCALIISDYGRGVNRKHIGAVFVPGWKESISSKGTGMGLTYAKHVVEELHEGSLKAGPTSDDVGLTIEIELPVYTGR